MTEKESSLLIRRVAEDSLSAEEEDCPLEQLESAEHQAMILLMGLCLKKSSPHAIAHALFYSYKAGKRFAEERALEGIVNGGE